MRKSGATKLPVVHSPSSTGTRRELFAGTLGAARKTDRDSAKAQKPAKTAPETSGTTISVNGKNFTVKAPGETPLLYVLRDELLLRGPRFGCGLSECGACAVLQNGKQIRSCVTPLSAVGKTKIVTLEGLSTHYYGYKKGKGKLHPLQKAWIDHQVPQCGYCQSGMMIQAADLLSKKLKPTEPQIKTAMDGHLCRCGSHFRIIKGIEEAAKTMRSEKKWR